MWESGVKAPRILDVVAVHGREWPASYIRRLTFWKGVGGKEVSPDVCWVGRGVGSKSLPENFGEELNPYSYREYKKIPGISSPSRVSRAATHAGLIQRELESYQYFHTVLRRVRQALYV